MEIVALALALDALIGDPERLWRRIGHPVTWFGAAIAAADRQLNTGSPTRRRLAGALALAALVVAFAGTAAGLQAAFAALPAPANILLTAAAASTLLAHRSLHEHVAAVRDAPDLPAARTAVGRIVGRDTEPLDETGVARAALETLAESLSDGVVAPVFWLAVGGLPGLVAYKVVNTADSMIGHRTPRHEAFGWAAARLDDALNLIPARLTAALIALAARRAPPLATLRREAAAHASPNAGWPEAAFAHALGVSLGGPRTYDGEPVHAPWFNPTGAPPTRADIGQALRLSRNVGIVQAAAVLALAALL